MTTIAWRDGIMAADSQSSYGDWKVPGPTTKLFRLPNGSIVGVCGHETVWRAILDWLKSDQSAPQPTNTADESGRVIVARFSGGETYLTVYDAGFHYIEANVPFMAWGSGLPVALGALHAGATAEEAVRIASLVDKNTGGPVCTMRLHG